MRYVPEELYLTWKERAEVSRKYALELAKELERVQKSCSTQDYKIWHLTRENAELRSIPVAKIYKRLLKTRDRLWRAKENARKEIESLKTRLSEVKALTEAYLDVLKDKY